MCGQTRGKRLISPGRPANTELQGTNKEGVSEKENAEYMLMLMLVWRDRWKGCDHVNLFPFGSD